jgi:hypothetical protein
LAEVARQGRLSVRGGTGSWQGVDGMSFKRSLHVGYFDPDTGMLLPLAVDVSAAREAIVWARGRLPEQCGSEDAQYLAIAAAMKSQANREVLGFIDREFVVLHEAGFLMTTIDYASHGKMLAFLWHMSREVGCQVYSPDEGVVVTEEILNRLAVWADVVRA